MSRKTIVFCICLLCVLVIGIAAAVVVLYSGVDDSSDYHSKSVRYSDYGLLQAVPADAVAVMEFDSAEDFEHLASYSRPFVELISSRGRYASFFRKCRLSEYKLNSLVLSLHYNGGMMPLVVADAGRRSSSGEHLDRLCAMADSAGLAVKIADAGEVAAEETGLDGRRLLFISSSESLIQSSLRHLAKGISILSLDNFARAADSVDGDIKLFYPLSQSGKLFAELFTKEYRVSSFVKSVADWTSASLEFSENGVSLSGGFLYDSGKDNFINTLLSTSGSRSHIAEILPSYAISAVSLPLDNVSAYVDSYKLYTDTNTGAAKYEQLQDNLERNAKISPAKWAKSLNFAEIATADFYLDGKLQKMLFLRPQNPSSQLLFRDNSSLKDYKPQVHQYPYAGFASAVFGKLFTASDETSFTYMNGWIIVGSETMIRDYVAGRALDYSLKSYLEDAGVASQMEQNGQVLVSYFSAGEDYRALDIILGKRYADSFKEAYKDCDFVPMFLKISNEGGLSFESFKLKNVKKKAPTFEREAKVKISKGPFKVKNSATGKINSFYQQDNLYLCLKDEAGKGLWGVPFDKPICGMAGTVDYFANGKLQILFAAGNNLHLIDRLGRFVSPFPVKLRKEVLLGPSIYDFNGKRKYNVMVLNKDNTVDMYNLQGRIPEGWKGITSKETIMELPEAVKVSGKTWWVVRTSIQTLIFPFYGGAPVDMNLPSGQSVRPDSPVKVVREGVELTLYNGKQKTIQLR